MAEPARRRRRVRPAQEPDPVATNEAGGAVPAPSDEPPPWVAPSEPDILPAERGLRRLVGGGSSQVTPAAAMRARDAARPRPKDLARAEAELTIVHRHWSPRD